VVPLKILFIDYYFPPGTGGSEILAGQLVRKFVSLGHEVVVLTRSYREYSFEEDWNGAKVFRVKVPESSRPARLVFMLRSIRKASELSKKFRPDVIVTQELFSVLAGYYLKRKTHLPYMHIHELISESIPTKMNRVKMAFQRLVLPRMNCDVFVSWSNFMKEKYLDKWGMRAPVTVIPACVDTEIFSPRVDGSSVKGELNIKNSFLLVTAKQLYKISAKGLEQTLIAIKELAPNYSNLKYLIVGDGNGRTDLEVLAKQLGIDDRVIFAGEKPHSDIPGYLAAADAIIQTFAIEVTTGTSLLEAAAIGKPLIVTRCGDIGNVLDESCAVFTVMNNPKSVAEGITWVINHPEDAQRKGENAVRLVESKFTIDAIASQLIDKLKEISSNPRL
jgi:1,2-diacylglycerol 3-alpha-glucosyltransferase